MGEFLGLVPVLDGFSVCLSSHVRINHKLQKCWTVQNAGLYKRRHFGSELYKNRHKKDKKSLYDSDRNFHIIHENDLEIFDHICINCSLSFEATAIVRGHFSR